MKFFFTTLFQQYYRGFSLRARFVLLRIFAGLLYVTESLCLRKEKSKLKTREKLKETLTGELTTLKVNLQVFISSWIIKELGDKANADLYGSLFNFMVEYSFGIGCNADFEIACNADSRISIFWNWKFMKFFLIYNASFLSDGICLFLFCKIKLLRMNLTLTYILILSILYLLIKSMKMFTLAVQRAPICNWLYGNFQSYSSVV